MTGEVGININTVKKNSELIKLYFSNFVREQSLRYQVGKKGWVKSNLGFWKERGSKIIFSLILRLLGRISSGRGDRNYGEENQDFKKMGMGKNIKLQEPLYNPHCFR